MTHVIIPTGASRAALYDEAGAAYGYACETAGIPTGRPIPKEAADLVARALPMVRGFVIWTVARHAETDALLARARAAIAADVEREAA